MKRAITMCAAGVLALAGCGEDDVTPRAAATPTATATATAAPTEVAEAPTPDAGKCDEVERRLPEDTTGTVHPGSNFFEPGAEGRPTPETLDHLLLRDNAVVVTYAADTPKKTRERLYEWTYADVTERTPVVVPDDSPDALPVRARIASIELRCNGWDWKRLTRFVNRTDVAPLSGHG